MKHLARYRFWYLLTIGLLLLALVLRWNAITMPFERDEGEYAYGASLLLHGGVPYQEAFMQKPPMILYTYAAAQLVSEEVWAPRVLGLLALIASALTLAAIVVPLYGKTAGTLAALLLVTYVSERLFLGFSAQPELFQLLPLVLSWWCVFAYQRDAKGRWLVAFGALSAFAVLYKPIVAPMCLFATLYLACNPFVWRAALMRLAVIALSSATTLVVVLLPVSLLGGFTEFVDAAIVYNWHYANAVAFSWAYLWRALGLCLLPAVLLSVWLIARRVPHALFWVGLLGAAFLGTAGSMNPHYYIILLPGVCVLLGIGLTNLARELPSLPERGRRLFPYACALLVVAVLVYPERERLVLTPTDMMEWIYPLYPFAEAPVIARVSEENSQPGDRIFIYGNEPEILYYAKRESVTRFVITYPATIETPRAARYQAEILAELVADPPKLIVTTGYVGAKKYWGDPDTYRYTIHELISSQYELVGRIERPAHDLYAFIYTTSTPASILEVGDTSLALYKRKD